jgi:hypothetical protein
MKSLIKLAFSFLLENTDEYIKVENTLINGAKYTPTEKDYAEKFLCATHAIIDEKLVKITERGNKLYGLENGNHYYKDSLKNDVKVIWVRIHVIDYDKVSYDTW